MRRFMVLVLLLAGTISLSGCETLRGMGRDVNNVGDALLGN